MKYSFLLLYLFFLMGSLHAQDHKDTAMVYFDFDRSVLSHQSNARLDSFINLYHASGNKIPIELRGFCDSMGTNAYNDRLSEQRVQAVQDYLVGKGVSPSSIILKKGWGERMPLNSNSTEEERQQNRRVDLVYTSAAAPVPEKSTTTVFSKETISTAKEGEVLQLKNINFEGGRHLFLPQSLPALNELVQVMKDHPTLKIEIQGHICCFTGIEDGVDFDTNERKLSLNRAHAVFNYLVDHGIEASRMSYKGFGGSRHLVDPELTEEDRTTNRRVEVMIVSK